MSCAVRVSMLDTSVSSGKPYCAILVTRAYLLTLVGDMLGGGKGLVADGRKKVFGWP
jgi:hypothetical protein